MKTAAALLSLAMLAIACSSATTTGTDTRILSVGGTYPTTVTLSQSTCPGITVANASTNVMHTAGGSALTLTHVGNDYQGTVTSQGDFTTQPKTVSGGGEAHALTIAGKFTTTGFTATVNVSVTRPTAPTTCAYTVTWAATKTGSANTFP